MNTNLRPKAQGVGDLLAVLGTINDDKAAKARFEELVTQISRLEELTQGYKNVKEIELAHEKAHTLRAAAENDRVKAKVELDNAKKEVAAIRSKALVYEQEQAKRFKRQIEESNRQHVQTKILLAEAAKREKAFETDTIFVKSKLAERERLCSDKETLLRARTAHWIEVAQTINELVN